MADKTANSDAGDFESLQKELSRISELVDDLMSGRTPAGERAQRLLRKGKKVVGKAVSKGKAAVSSVESTVSDHPLASVAVAFGVGVLLGRLIRR